MKIQKDAAFTPHAYSFLVVAMSDGQGYRMRMILLLGLILGTNLRYSSRSPSPPQDLRVLPS